MKLQHHRVDCNDVANGQHRTTGQAEKTPRGDGEHQT